MRVVTFQPRFEQGVAAGTKLRTMRKRAGCVVGDVLSLRVWSGKPYRSKQREIARRVCTGLREVMFYPEHESGRCGVLVSGVLLPFGERDAFARADGFANFEEMLAWVLENYGQKTGCPVLWLIEWGGKRAIGVAEELRLLREVAAAARALVAAEVRFVAESGQPWSDAISDEVAVCRGLLGLWEGCVPEGEARMELKTFKLDEQRKALAEARQRIIARCEEVRGWLQQPAPDVTIANWSGIVEGLAQARRIIGGMWDELPVPTPQAVIDHQNAIAGKMMEGVSAVQPLAFPEAKRERR